jgi:hypothetical protein
MVAVPMRIYVSLIKVYDNTIYFIIYNIILTSPRVFRKSPLNTNGVYLSTSLTKIYLHLSKRHSVK